MSKTAVTKKVTTNVLIDPNGPKNGPKKEVQLQDAQGFKYSLDQSGLDDAVKDLGLSEIVDLVNTQSMTNAMNAIRSAYTKGPSAEWLSQKAQERIYADPAKVQQLVAHNGDWNWINTNLIQPEIAAVRAEYDAQRASQVVNESPEAPEGQG